MKRKFLPAGLAGLVVAGVALAACAPGSLDALLPFVSASPTTATSTAVSASPPGQASAGTAIGMLDALTASDQAPAPEYDRDEFGTRWADVDHNGCDTRNDILARDLADVAFKTGSDCVVVSGILSDPYTGTQIQFTKSDASKVQIDHVVALSNAWDSGAYAWSADRREAFANDPNNLLAVDGAANMSKKDKSADEWLPANPDFDCEYVTRQVAIKTEYGLSVTPAEKAAMAAVLAGCPGQ